MVVPSIVIVVAFIVESKRGSRSGKESTGYNVPLELDLEIRAAMIVNTPESPKFPSTSVSINKP